MYARPADTCDTLLAYQWLHVNGAAALPLTTLSIMVLMAIILVGVLLYTRALGTEDLV